VSVWLDVGESCGGNVCWWHVQLLWGDVVQQLLGRLRVPRWFNFANACCRDMSCRHLQRIWRDVV
jgi:hypothetical protein